VNEPLAEVAALVHRRTGILIPPGRVPALQAALQRAAPGLGAAGFLLAASDPAAGPALVDRLIEEVTIQETSFVRDRGQLDPILWRRLGSAGKVRVWSAGCATGEEAYTLALLASESFAPARAPVDVLGTDVSATALDAARTGRYRERAVRGLDTRLRSRYLERQADGSYLVAGALRALVRFSRHNLVSDPLPPPGEPPFDLIVCRNVLIYFDPSTVARVSTLLERSLAPGGMLVLGAADVVSRTTALGKAAGAPPDPRAVPRPGNQEAGRAPVPGEEGRAAKAREERLAAAHAAAGAGDRASALALVRSLLADSPLDADAQFLYGLVTLEAGDPGEAAVALRRALYIDPGFALAAFTLGRARDALGDMAAARRAYEQALRLLDPDDPRHDTLLQQIDVADIAAACRARLAGQR
jgi:chemotaxis protein methyltransferase CheR